MMPAEAGGGGLLQMLLKKGGIEGDPSPARLLAERAW